jgi:Family of unknown function (DUF6909)
MESAGMDEAVEKFVILVRHGAICSRLEISQLLSAYRDMQPSLHRHCNTEDVVDIEAVLYAADRLPASIFQVKEILIQADVPDKLPEMAGLEKLSTDARRRPTFQVGDDVIIVVAREGRTELLDLITLLCTYQLEANKIADLLRGTAVYGDIAQVLQDDSHSLEDRNRLLARLAFELGTTDDLIVALDKNWNGELLERLHFLTNNPPRFVARLHRDYSIEASRSQAKKWATNLKREVEALHCGDGPVHILSSNTHSTVNLLAGYALQVEDEVWQWALTKSEHIEYLETAERTPNITYFLLRDWLKAHPQRKAEKESWEKTMGVCHLADAYYTGVHSQVIELAKVDPTKADPRLQPFLSKLQRSHAVLVNFDYAFGEQAGILVEQLFKAFQHRVASFSIMGKAGTVVGGRGGVMLPTYLLKEGSRDVYDLPFGNALQESDFSDLNLGKVHSGGPMLTVAGTILQNEKMLLKYREDWNILGLEMEGIPYIRALHQCLKRDWVSSDLEVLVGYYASDAPLEVGETLARELAFEGLDPTYGLNIAILRTIFKEREHATREEEKVVQDSWSHS